MCVLEYGNEELTQWYQQEIARIKNEQKTETETEAVIAERETALAVIDAQAGGAIQL